MRKLFFHRTKIETEVWRRIRLAVWAYAYEFESMSLVSDARFDTEARKVNLSLDTPRPDLDKWWRENFDPSTGMWIHKHPELSLVKKIYERFYR